MCRINGARLLIAFQGTESRMQDDYARTQGERAHLVELMASLQRMRDEAQRTGDDAAKRSQASIGRLEEQLTEARTRLSAEMESHRQLTVLREVEAGKASETVARLTAEHAATRETYLVAKTSVEHLQQRVDDLERSLAARDEKLAVYEGRSSNTTTGGPTSEQQLEAELAETRAELRAARLEVEQARTHVEQFRAISQANEEALAALNATYDQYRDETDAKLRSSEAAIAAADERVRVLTDQGGQSTTETLAAQRELAELAQRSAAERAQLEEQLEALRVAQAGFGGEKAAIEAELAKQVAETSAARDDYNRELRKHADSASNLSAANERLTELRTAALEHQKAAETAQANLQSATASWETQRSGLQKEITDLRARIDELSAQNTTLHEHLETVTAQATRIRQMAAADGDGSVEAVVGGSDSKAVEQLTELVGQLRRDREILELQLHMEKTNRTRAEQQLVQAERNLDRARLALTEERNRAGDSASAAAQHAELLDKVNSLNILRESNATLREETERATRRVAQLETTVRELTARSEPLEAELRTTRADVAARERQVETAEADAGRWKARYQQALERDGRIDPAEMQQLRDDLAARTAELAALQEGQLSYNDLHARFESTSRDKETLTTELANSRQRFRNLQEQARDHRNRFVAGAEEKTALEEKLAAVETEREAWNAAKTQLEAELGQLKASAADAQDGALVAAQQEREVRAMMRWNES